MRNLLAAILVMFAGLASAEDRILGIESTIQGQIDAFLVDDFETAFNFASPTIKRIFGSHERFGVMVRNGYPMVHRPSDVEFLELRQQGPLFVSKDTNFGREKYPIFHGIQHDRNAQRMANRWR